MSKGLKKIFHKLNMNPSNGLYILEENRWEDNLPTYLKDLIKNKLKPSAFFCINKKPIILFYDSPKNKQKLFQAIWNFNESPIVIINEHDSLNIFNGFSYLKEKASLEVLDTAENIKRLSYFNIISGTYLSYYCKKITQSKRVNMRLLSNIKDARLIIKNRYNLDTYLINALIGKCIFARYLIDRGIQLDFDGRLRKWTKQEFNGLFNNKHNIINFFKYLKTKFNGEAFLIDDERLKNIPDEVFKILQLLLRGSQLSTGQMSLFDIYDFSIIPIEFISNVYEYFIGKENQSKQGAYYTPKFVVDYILSETVEKYFNDNTSKYNCKVLDPACGSGIFLVETLRRIIERYKKLHNNKISNKKLKQLVEENIFGIDKDNNAINVAIFSIYLTLLDYQKSKDITKFKFPKLISNGNFFIADFFDTDAEFNTFLKKIKFNFILGNPPWKRGASRQEKFLRYIADRKQKEKKQNRQPPECRIGNKEIAQAFLIRTSDFSNNETKCAFIVTSKVLYNIQGNRFRKYFLYNFFVDQVCELAPVATEIFNSSNTPATILFFRYAHWQRTDENKILYISVKPNPLFKIFKFFVIQRHDIKQVLQRKLIQEDWLWKILIYGNYLDYNFIKRLMSEYLTIDDYIKKNKLTRGQGIIVGSKNKDYNAKQYLGWKLIDTKKDIQQFYVHPSLIFKENRLTRRRKKCLFKAPFLLIRHGLEKDLKATTAISYSDTLYKHSLTGIKSNLQTLKIICGLLNSMLFQYFILYNSTASIDRHRAHDDEKLNFPYYSNPKIANIVKDIENINKQYYKKQKQQILINSRNHNLENKRQILIQKLNEEIFNTFDLNEIERALVDYAINFIIPILKDNNYQNYPSSSISLYDKFLENYIQIFLNRFKNLFFDKCLAAEIYYTEKIIGVFFKVIPLSDYNNRLITWTKQDEETLLNKIVSLGIKKITENLFIQKDIRGFEKNGFYIIKPNEKKLWHSAIAYLDVNDFHESIVYVGKKQYYESKD